MKVAIILTVGLSLFITFMGAFTKYAVPYLFSVLPEYVAVFVLFFVIALPIIYCLVKATEKA